MSEYWNRSGEVNVEFDVEKFTAKLYIDGKFVLSRPIWDKLTPKALVKNLWEVEEGNETYEKKTKWGLHTTQKKKVIKNGFKEFTKEYNVVPSRAVKIFNAAVYRNAIAPYKEFSNLFQRKKRIAPSEFTKVVNNVELLEQAKKDNQRNILPLILRAEASPQHLKTVFGKGAWKKLANNSFHRNQVLSTYQDISSVMEYDSTALKMNHFFHNKSPDAHHWLKNVVGIPYTKHEGQHPKEILALYVDTKDMAKRLELPFNEKWSARKVEEKHNEYAQLQQRLVEQQRIGRDKWYAERLAKLKAVDLSEFYAQTAWEKDGVVAKLLTTYDRITQEGAEMHHCVAGYAERCTNRDYVVVSLTDGVMRTTLGIYADVAGGNVYRFHENQHYGKYNKRVEDERFITLAKEVVDSLNKMKLKKEENA